ncbi:MAG: hypothetical protein ACKVP0_10290 [Pirellulaceae bacterium]
MKIDALLQQLKSLGVNLHVDGGRLLFRAPHGAVTPDIRTAVAANRTNIIQRLQAAAPAGARPLCAFCDRRNWVDEPPKDGRIRTTCGKCTRFIGYRPAVPRNFA